MIHPIESTKVIRSYFGGNTKKGRTTTLIVRNSGEKLIEIMGDVSRKDAYRAYADEQARAAMAEGDDKKALSISTQCGLGMEFFNLLASCR